MSQGNYLLYLPKTIMDDTFRTIIKSSEGLYKEKMSKFLSFAEPCTSAEEAKEIVAMYKKEYYDARHVC